MDYTILSKVDNMLTGAVGRYFTCFIVEINSKQYVFVEENNGDRVVISDEGYWNPASAVGDELSMVADVVRNSGKIPGVVITPYSLREFGGKVGIEELYDQVSRTDFFSIDPYITALEVDPEMLLKFSADAVQHSKDVNKKITLCLQGFAPPGKEEMVKKYNLDLVALDFDEVLVCDALDFPDIPDEWQISTDDAMAAFQSKNHKSIFEKIKMFFKKIFSKLKSLLSL